MKGLHEVLAFERIYESDSVEDLGFVLMQIDDAKTYLEGLGAVGTRIGQMEQIQKYGTMVKPPTGFPIQSPYLSIANRQAEIMMRIASEFGFTPASRSRISAPLPDQLPLFDGVRDQEG